MTDGDVVFAERLRALEGWNQTPQDWRRSLAMEPGGCFIALWNGAPVGTIVTTVYGQELAWIGMLLVHPDYRRRRIGNALLKWAIRYLKERKVCSIKLDATPAGKVVYNKLGFKEEWTLSRWEGVYAPLSPSTPELQIRNWRKGNARSIDRLDAEAFGVSRRKIVEVLARQSLCAQVLESNPERIAGYGLLRKGSRAMQLGPVVAASAEEGIALVENLLAHSHGNRIFWDIPHPNAAAMTWVRRQGFTVQRPLTRMVLGENSTPGDPMKQFAIAGPELG